MTSTQASTRTITSVVTRTAPTVIRSLEDVRALYRAAQPDGHWFDADTMRAFGTRLMSQVFADGQGGAYFCTSEPYAWTGPRVYTVRHINAAGEVTTVGGELGTYATRDKALREARTLASATA
jgi:hypothetical protein